MRASDAARLALLAMLCLAAGPLAAQQNTREQEQLRRLRQQLQQLQQGQSAQQDAAAQAAAETTAAKAQLAAVQADLQRARGAAVGQGRNAAALQQQLDTLRADAGTRQLRTEQLQAQLQDSGKSLEQQRSSGSDLQRRLSQRETELADLGARHRGQAGGLQACIANNAALRTLGHELLQRYADKGLGETFAHTEPFVQRGRVQLENLVQGYQDKLDQQALAVPSAASAAWAASAPQSGAR